MMAKYYQKIAFEREIISTINNHFSESELIGLSENSINMWWNKIEDNKINIIVFDKVTEISKKYGFIIEESNLLRNVPVDNNEINELTETLKVLFKI